MRFRLLSFAFLFAASLFTCLAQDAPAAKPAPTEEVDPQYRDTFSGPVVELSADRIVVSRSILGKPPEKHAFLIKPDTRIEGKLKPRAKVTVGFVTSDEGDIARLIVVRPPKR